MTRISRRVVLGSACRLTVALATAPTLWTLAGCGAGQGVGAESAQDTGDRAVLADATPYGPRRGIQAVYFLALEPGFVNDICGALNRAPSGKTIEIEFSAAHSTGRSGDQGFANAVRAINALPGRDINFVVDFGHHTIGADHTPADWGRALYNGLFREYSNRARFYLQVANEDEYPNAEWETKMRQILQGLRDAWGTRTPFPYNRIFLRRTPIRAGATVPASLAFDNRSIPVEGEYHFPAAADINWNNASPAVSNDGQIVYQPGIDPNPWAYGTDNRPLRQLGLRDFKVRFGGRALLLWHPSLHRWQFRSGAYYANGDRMDASAENRTKFLTLLRAFMEN